MRLELAGFEPKSVDYDFSISSHHLIEIGLDQPIVHDNVDSDTFEQRCILYHLHDTLPMVIQFSGYSARPLSSLHELSAFSNHLIVEHRFFGESTPEEIPWDALSIEEAANDHHRIIQKLRTIYTGPWLSSGISKGGQAALYHRYLFPDDVDASLVYVAPLNLSFPEGRIDSILAQRASSPCGERILAVQKRLLQDYDRALSSFMKESERRGMDFPGSDSTALELSVMEYPFSFWQWDSDCLGIPDTSVSVEVLISHLFDSGSPDFFSTNTVEELYPFFYQSYTELGMYDYPLERFDSGLQVLTEDYSLQSYFLQPRHRNLKPDLNFHHELAESLTKESGRLILVYGALDPWTSCAPKTERTQSLVLIHPEGNHKTRLKDFSPTIRNRVEDSLSSWLEIPFQLHVR